MAMRRTEVEFNKDGQAFAAAQVQSVLDGLPNVTDLIVATHGWNNDMAEARGLFDELLGNVDRLLDTRDLPTAPAPIAGLRGRTFAACQVFWPSKKFADEDLIPGGGAATAMMANDAALMRTLDGLAHDPVLLGDTTVSPVKQQIVARAKTLVPRLNASDDARREFVFCLRSLLDPDRASADDGSDSFFTTDPLTLFQDLDGDIVAPLPAGAGGAANAAGAAAGLGDLLNGATAAARRLANFTTYYQMKNRAGTVGSVGLAPVLRRIRERSPQVKLHLAGHSFGGRLLTAAAHGLDAGTPDVTIGLLQAAFSHNGFSADFGDGQAGSYRAVVSERRASGPIYITHTKNDSAVGIAYPLASRIARQNAAALGDANDPYGGMGRNGAQRTAEAEGNATTLRGVGHDYRFAAGRIYNLLSDEIIKSHSDIRGIQVAYAILSAARAV
jgi:hypothetical protein